MESFKSKIVGATSDSNEPTRLMPINPGSNFLTQEDWNSVAKKLQLTGREVEVAIQVLLGGTRKKIAGQLKISPETVRFHIDGLFHKF